MKTALICGVSGQDGSWLARLLLEKGYRVVGTSRDAQLSSFRGLRRLGVLKRVELLSMGLNDFRSVLQVLKRIEPDEVYNLAGQSSVALSYEQPVETMESISLATLNLLEGYVSPSVPFVSTTPVRANVSVTPEAFRPTKKRRFVRSVLMR